MSEVRQLIVFSLFSLLCIDLISANNNETLVSQDRLVFAHVIFRHGDRNPLASYPTDPYKNHSKYWKDGFGQLTNIGKMQHYDLGQYLRERYAKILGIGEYLRDIVYVESTDLDRTIMSAASNLAGFFPPDKRQTWDTKLPWQPVPVHSIPERYDHLLGGTMPCARYNYAEKRYKRSVAYQKMITNYQPLFEYLAKHSGKAVKTVDDAFYIYDTIWIEHLKNYTLPAWARKLIVPNGNGVMDRLANRAFKDPTNTRLMARLKIGFLLREMLTRFDSKINSELSPDRSLWVYSAHDSTISGIFNTLSIWQDHRPPYASAVLFELHKSRRGYNIQLFYKNSTNLNLKPLHIPSCGTRCPLEKFRKIYAAVIPTGDFQSECKLSILHHIHETFDLHGFGIGLLVLASLILAAMIVIIVISCKVCREGRKRAQYQRVL